MKKLLLAALAALGILSAPAPAHAAQDQVLALVVTTCGTLAAPYVAGKYGIITMDTTGKLCDGSSGGGGTVLTKSGTYVSSGTDQFALAVGTNTQLTVPATTTCAQITVEGASIRRTSDTTSATTTNGTLIPAGASWQDCGPLAAYKFTAVSGSPTLDVEYFK